MPDAHENYQVDVTRLRPHHHSVSLPLTRNHAQRLFTQLKENGYGIHVKLVDMSRPHKPLDQHPSTPTILA